MIIQYYNHTNVQKIILQLAFLDEMENHTKLDYLEISQNNETLAYIKSAI